MTFTNGKEQRVLNELHTTCNSLNLQKKSMTLQGF